MINEVLIDKAIQEMFSNIEFTPAPQGLYDPLRYMIGIGGKRIRPRLCLTTYGLFKDEFGDGVLDAAEALEVFHTFTLIHDDIMDNAPIRRGMTTVWKKWDANTAILSGDVMSIDSYRRMAKVNPKALPAAIELFNRTAAQVCEGQQYDMEFEDLPRISMEDYIAMVELKTAVLIACSAKMGAIIAGADPDRCDALYDFGFDLGVAFQITDDYLDTFSDAKTFGKAIGGDILNCKKTWLLTRAMEKDFSGVKEAMAMPVGTPEADAAKIAAVTGLYRTLGVDCDASREIQRLHAKATGDIEKLGLSRLETELLVRYADRLVGRTK